jgi:hypothetical protein
MLLVVPALLAAACGGGGGGAGTPRVTVGPRGPLEEALLTATQIRQVPSLSTAKVAPLAALGVFDDPDPRAPCGATVPRLALTDVAAIGISAENIRGGAQLIARLGPGEAKRYLDARQADTSKGCPPYDVETDNGTTQRVQLVRVVRVHREFDQALAVVLAVTVGTTVRAATEIEVRRGDILARAVIYTNLPLPNTSVRGIASVMGRNLSVFSA